MIHKALKLLRVYHGLKGCELAKKLDLDFSYFSFIESGKRRASVELIKKYADVFKIKPEDILLFAEKLEKDPAMEAKIIVNIIKTIRGNI